MPTIQINTSALPVPKRRAVAVRLTRWLSARGVRPAHVVVRFAEDPPGTVFTGGMPVEALPHDPGALRHASVVCCVSPERDAHFRLELADEIAQALGMTERTPFLHIDFRTTAPSDVYLAIGGRMTRADEVAPVPHRGETT
ncbi:hypothetical protein ACFWNN_07710 [Lentzea sp. NPDC058450]|uniref:hypothetical protein n=1 Tax=Lentzea sp. NPDC058450 TaxID=3346505 RepID=UPI00365BC471